MIDKLTRDEKVELCARTAHELERIWRTAEGEDAHLWWDAAPEHIQESARKGVLAALSGATPEEQHEAWCKFKRETGWKHGPAKNEQLKEHDCLVPYDQLPAHQRAKDELYITTVRNLALMLGAVQIHERGSLIFEV